MPPEAVEYQFRTPVEVDALRVTVPGPQLDPGVVLVIVGVGFIIKLVDVLHIEFPHDT